MNKYFRPSLLAQSTKAAPGNWRSRRPAFTLDPSRHRIGLRWRTIPIMIWQTHSWAKPIVQARLDCIDATNVRTLQKTVH
jgi:hypothetical protein